MTHTEPNPSHPIVLSPKRAIRGQRRIAQSPQPVPTPSSLAALVAPDFGASEPAIEEAAVETIEEEEVVEVPVSKPLSAREAAKADMADDDDFFGDDDDADEDKDVPGTYNPAEYANLQVS